MFRITAFLVFIIFLMSGISYWYYQDTQTRIQALRENTAKLEVAIKTSIQTIDNMIEQNKLNQELINELNQNLQDAEQYNSELRRLFQEHNLTLLAEEKPGLIEKRINDATLKVFDSIMHSTIPR